MYLFPQNKLVTRALCTALICSAQLIKVYNVQQQRTLQSSKLEDQKTSQKIARVLKGLIYLNLGAQVLVSPKSALRKLCLGNGYPYETYGKNLISNNNKLSGYRSPINIKFGNQIGNSSQKYTKKVFAKVLLPRDPHIKTNFYQ